MNYDLSEMQQEISALARTVLEPRSLALGKLSRLPASEEFLDEKTWKLLAKTDLLGAFDLTDEDGDADGGFLSLCTLLVEIGRAAARVPAIETLLPAWTVRHYGTQPQQELADTVGRGEVLLSLGLHEEGAYSFGDLTTSATRHGEAWSLTGSKTDIGYARHADRILVPARVGDDTCVLLLVDPSAAGVSLTDLETSTRQPSCAANFEAVLVPEMDVVGGAELPYPALQTLWHEAATAVCALQLGFMEAATAMTVQHISSRKQFGRELATFQAIAMQAADVHVAMEAARLTFWEAAWRLARGKPAAEEVAIAKYWSAFSSAKVMTAAQHLHGGMGVDTDYPLHAYVLWSLSWQRQFGSASSQLHELGELIAAERKSAR